MTTQEVDINEEQLGSRVNFLQSLVQNNVNQTERKERQQLNFDKLNQTTSSKILNLLNKDNIDKENHDQQLNPEDLKTSQVQMNSVRNEPTKHKLDQIPPDFNLAQQHRLASIVGRDLQVEELEEDEQPEICECCARQIQKQYIDYKCQTKVLAFLGSGYTMYFDFILECQKILIGIFMVSGIFNLITNAMGSACLSNEEMADFDAEERKKYCHVNWITIFSLGNKQKEYDLNVAQDWLNLASLFLIIALLQYFRYRARLTEIECDAQEISADDYAIYIKNIPLSYDAVNDDYDDDLKEFFETKLLKDQNIEVKMVNLCYNTNDLSKFEKRKQEILKTKKELISKNFEKKNQNFETELQNIENDLINLHNDRSNLLKKYEDGKGKQFMEMNFVGQAFIQFNYESQVELILEKYSPVSIWHKLLGQNKQIIIYHGNELKIEKAPSPSDVFWNNLSITDKQRSRRELVGYFVISISLSIFLFITWQLGSLQALATGSGQGKDNSFGQIVAALVSTFVSMSNGILTYIMRSIASYLRHNKRTFFNIEIAKYLSTSMFLNSAIIPLTLNVIVQSSNHFGRIYSSAGLVYNQNYVFINNIIIGPTLQYIDIERKLFHVKRKFIKRKKDKCVLTQQELNEAWENPEFKISERYAACLNTVFMSAFYATVLPQCLIWSMLALSSHYYGNFLQDIIKVDKWNFLRHRTIKFNLSAELSHEMIEQLEYFLPIFSVSNIIFEFYMYPDKIPHPACFIGVIIGLLHAFLPMAEINEKIFKIPAPQPNLLSFDEVVDKFHENYNNTNPCTQEFAMKKKLEKIKTMNLMKFQKRNNIAFQENQLHQLKQLQNIQPIQQENEQFEESSDGSVSKNLKQSEKQSDSKESESFQIKSDQQNNSCSIKSKPKKTDDVSVVEFSFSKDSEYESQFQQSLQSQYNSSQSQDCYSLPNQQQRPSQFKQRQQTNYIYSSKDNSNNDSFSNYSRNAYTERKQKKLKNYLNQKQIFVEQEQGESMVQKFLITETKIFKKEDNKQNMDKEQNVKLNQSVEIKNSQQQQFKDLFLLSETQEDKN